MQRWTLAIKEMAAGASTGTADSGEVDGLSPAALTLTVGLGASLFDGRFGLADRRPEALVPIPALPGDELAVSASSGDLVIQACADDLIVASHAVRQLLRLAEGVARVRWLQTGFAPPETGSPPRNPLGFIDGTANPDPGSDAFASTVWVTGAAGQEWLVDGTFLCFRRIRIDLVRWDELTTADQQVVIGRTKRSGAPLSGGSLNSPLGLGARGRDGSLLIPSDSHVRVAAPQLNGGATLFRRSFAYENGTDPNTHQPDAGQLFLAWVADPRRQFVPLLKAVSEVDRLAQFTTHTASGIWAVPPAPGVDGWLGEPLLG